MSIPPFVCSTPPPPEQCEDDKDHEDFDITYNLSQEEDDDGTDYNYANYSSYNIYQTKSENVEKGKWNSNVNNLSVNDGEQKNKSEEILNSENFITNTELAKENIISKSDETVVEDLNLIVNNNIVHSNDIQSKEFETEVEVEFECSEKQTEIQDEGGTNITTKDENIDLNVCSLINKISISNENKILDDKNEAIHMNSLEDVMIDKYQTYLVNDLEHTMNIETKEIVLTKQVINMAVESPKAMVKDSVPNVENESPLNLVPNDDFGDFEDFHITATSENCQVLSVTSENPWESDCNVGPEFGDFTVSFDVKETKSVENIPNAILCEVKEFQANVCPENNDDDFGDFDNFQSSDDTEIAAHTNEETSEPDVALWNLNSPDNDQQIIDSINSLLTSIFSKEIPEPDNVLLVKLESFLRETWGHLIDIEVRQPYMVNWNNSLGQKTLLKALCIDSRNILFAPKWNYNTPKYAVNLTAAPLQPQKQFVPSTSSNESAEKLTNKDVGAWGDPFTPDGQESCNGENKSVPNVTASRPTEVDVFESNTSTNLSKIYSNTINIQPIRHINLPDTHIFTPTDSETPRSKTIHYDSDISGVVSQSAQETNKSNLENMPSQICETVDWDFQDFKTAKTVFPILNTNTEATDETAVKNTDNVKTYQAQILQPIKLDPIMPTLNWPDPGEVKETFDDFSDFVSSTSWNNEKENQTPITLDTQKDVQKISKEKVFTAASVDDEFETFQSAPVLTSAIDVHSTIIGTQISPSENLETKTVDDNCDNPSVKIESKNSKNNHSVILINQNSSVADNMSDMQDIGFPQTTLGIQNTNTDILQPTTASSSGLSRHQHRSDQILQPLSLESYSQINWPNPGIDLQDLSRFNPINSLNSLKSDSSTSGNSKNASPAHNSANPVSNQTSDDDIWGDFVSSAPKQQHPTPKKTTFADDDEWTDFVSSPSMKPQNGLNTISFNVHTNLSMQKSSHNNFGPRNNQIPLDIPTLNYITPKSSNRGIYSEKHFQNL